MLKDEIVRLLDRHAKENDFSGPAKTEKIEMVEQRLGVSLPESYKWFLMNYGSGGIYGVSVSGCENAEAPSVVLHTERYRKLGLGNGYVVIEDVGDLVYCLDTSRFENDECPVVSWTRGSRTLNTRYDNFYSYLLDVYQEAIDNWDEE